MRQTINQTLTTHKKKEKETQKKARREGELLVFTQF